MQRAWTERLAFINLIPKGTHLAPVDMGGVRAISIQHATGTGRLAILYLHGGGYVIGSARAEAVIAAHLARASGATVYTLDYRLAPEHPFPAALEDTRAAYEWLLGRGADPARVALVGDSAGSGLALAEAVRAATPVSRCRSARADLALAGPDAERREHGVERRKRADPEARVVGRMCPPLPRAGAADDPRASPLFADLHGLPPTLVHAGDDDILLSDAESVAERLAGAGVDVRLSRFDGLWHDFHLHALACCPPPTARSTRSPAFLERG